MSYQQMTDEQEYSEEETVTCKRCSQSKPLFEMKKDSRYASGYSSYCRSCHSAATVAWQKAHPERVKAVRRARYSAKREDINQARRAAYDYSGMRWARLKTLYGVTQEWFDSTLAKQGGVCAICKRPPSEFSRAFHVDHNHDCCPKAPACGNCNRGLLCHGCNTTLHSIERDKSWIKSAMEYLGATA